MKKKKKQLQGKNNLKIEVQTLNDFFHELGDFWRNAIEKDGFFF